MEELGQHTQYLDTPRRGEGFDMQGGMGLYKGIDSFWSSHISSKFKDTLQVIKNNL